MKEWITEELMKDWADEAIAEMERDWRKMQEEWSKLPTCSCCGKHIPDDEVRYKFAPMYDGKRLVFTVCYDCMEEEYE